MIANSEGEELPMADRPKPPETHFHGPENAEHELRKAYNVVVETGVTYFWDRRAIHGVSPDEAVTLYRHAYNAYRRDDRLAAERWARSVKHLARAFWSEAKIAYLEPRESEVPHLEGAAPEEYNLHERLDTTIDLLDSLADHVPPGLEEMPEDMRRYLSRARRHIEVIGAEAGNRHELLRAEHIKAAHEYGRVLECMALAYEAESHGKTAA
jgi:hypothetical protein